MTIYFDKIDNDLSTASIPCGFVEMVERPGVYRNLLKRVLDVCLILVAAPIVIPVIAILALLVARDGHAPFFWSTRVGKNGRQFQMLKLRTMLPDAEYLLQGHIDADPIAKREWEATQKLKNDPRITVVGRMLRKASLDELPQLWNVLIGDMSLVGPRPMLSAQRALYPGLSYYALHPGITGPWQVSDRNESEFAKRADHDRDYDLNVSFSEDFRLLVRTVGAVIRGTGY